MMRRRRKKKYGRDIVNNPTTCNEWCFPSVINFKGQQIICEVDFLFCATVDMED